MAIDGDGAADAREHGVGAELNGEMALPDRVNGTDYDGKVEGKDETNGTVGRHQLWADMEDSDGGDGANCHGNSWDVQHGGSSGCSRLVSS